MQLATVSRGRAAQMRSVAWRVAVGLAVGALLIVVFLRLVDLSTVYRHLSHLNVAYVLLAGAAFLGAYAVRALRWRWLLKPGHVSIGRVIAIYQVATFLNWLLPVQAGEVAKSLLLQRSDGIPVSRSFATVGMDKTMDLLPAVGILALLPFAGLHLSGLLWAVLILALAALGAAFTVLALAAWKPDRTLAVLKWPLTTVLRGRARDRAGPSIAAFLDTAVALARRPRVLLVATAYTAAAASLDGLSCLFTFRAVGVFLRLPVVFYGYTFMNLTFILPTPPAHLGFTEVISLLVFSGLLGVSRSAVAAMTLFSHSFDGILLTGSGLLALSRMGLTLTSGMRLIRNGSQAGGEDEGEEKEEDGNADRRLSRTFQSLVWPHEGDSTVKVLHVITGLGVGGAEIQLRSLLQHSRHECDVVALHNPGPVTDMLRGDGVRVRNLGMTSNRQVSALPRLWAVIRQGRYDVVHTHVYRSQIYGRPAARLAGVPVVISTEHSIGETLLEGRRMTPWVRALYLGTEAFSDMTIAVSPAVRDRLVKWGVRERKLAVIPNGIDTARAAFDMTAGKQARAEFGIGGDDYVIGVLGRLDPNKQFDLVIEAAAPMLRPGVILLIVGQGDELSRLRAAADRCGAAGGVVFAGERHDVGAMLSAMDLFVASSREETFGLSVVEALANGLPVLYTTCPAVEGRHLAQARRVPGTVAGLRDALAAEMGAGRRERSPEPMVEKDYNIKDVAARIDDLYERLAVRRRLVRRKAAVAASAPGPRSACPR